jgi:UDP-glucose 4-epimerase
VKYLITGGAGFIGSYLAESLISRGDQVVVFDNLST